MQYVVQAALVKYVYLFAAQKNNQNYYLSLYTRLVYKTITKMSMRITILDTFWIIHKPQVFYNI